MVAAVPAEALRPAGGGVQAAEGGHLAAARAGAVTLVCGVQSDTVTSYYCCIISCLHDALYRHDELAVAAGGVPAVLHGDVPRAVREEGAVVVAAVAGAVHVLGGQHRGALHLQQIQGGSHE